MTDKSVRATQWAKAAVTILWILAGVCLLIFFPHTPKEIVSTCIMLLLPLCLVTALVLSVTSLIIQPTRLGRIVTTISLILISLALAAIAFFVNLFFNSGYRG